MMILHTKTGTVELSDITIRALKRAWATKDVDYELCKMHLWLLQHERQRPAYIWRFFRNWMLKAPDTRAPQSPQHAGWWRSEMATLAMGHDIGISPRPGEEMAQFRERINAALAERRH